MTCQVGPYWSSTVRLTNAAMSFSSANLTIASAAISTIACCMSASISTFFTTAWGTSPAWVPCGAAIATVTWEGGGWAAARRRFFFKDPILPDRLEAIPSRRIDSW